MATTRPIVDDVDFVDLPDLVSLPDQEKSKVPDQVGSGHR